MLRVTDTALLIKGHEFRGQDFEVAVHDVMAQVQREQSLRDDQTAHIYATVVESCDGDSPISKLEERILHGFKTRPQ